MILKFKLPTLVTKKCIQIWSINFHENAARNVNRRTIAIAKQVSSNVFSTLIDAKRQGENINPIAWATWFTNSIRPNWKLSVFHILHIVKIWILEFFTHFISLWMSFRNITCSWMIRYDVGGYSLSMNMIWNMSPK